MQQEVMLHCHSNTIMILNSSNLTRVDIEVPAWLLSYHDRTPGTQMSEKSVGSEDWIRAPSPSSSDDEGMSPPTSR